MGRGDLLRRETFGWVGSGCGAEEAGEVERAGVGGADDAVADAVDAVALAGDFGGEQGDVGWGEAFWGGDGQVELSYHVSE